MNKYRVFLNGRNFWMKVDRQPKRMGFYTTRFVEADLPEEAESLAVQLIRKDTKLQKVVHNKKSDPPMIYLEGIALLKSFKGIKLPGTGYVFYEEKRRIRKVKGRSKLRA